MIDTDLSLEIAIFYDYESSNILGNFLDGGCQLQLVALGLGC